jgi:hypothetical protein
MSETDDTELQSMIAPLVQRIWQAYKDGNASAHNALLASDYTAVHPNGSRHLRPPTQEEIRSAPLDAFSLTKLQVARVTADTALVNYIADVDGPSNGKRIHVRWQVGEVWVSRGSEWKCRYYQPTLLASADGSAGKPAHET